VDKQTIRCDIQLIKTSANTSKKELLEAFALPVNGKPGSIIPPDLFIPDIGRERIK
jgi:hypothetical protein